MKVIFKLMPLLFVLSFTNNLKAQDAGSLIKEGIELNNQHKYAEALEKYKAALNLEPGNPSANYQMAFSLNALGKGQEALPYLQKVVQSNPSAAITGSSYELMGTIYDQAKQSQKAIESYQQGIKADSTDYSLRYNLGLAYFRNHHYAAAEESAIAAIKLNPNHASSLRLYALVTFHQNKRAAALLGFCSFLWLEPASPRSAEAYGNIQHILQGGALKAEPGEASLRSADANTAALNLAITQSVTAVSKRKYAGTAEQLSEQLKAIFIAVGGFTEKHVRNDRFFNHLAQHYYQLAQSPNIPVFAYFISQSTDKTAAFWLKDHQQQVADLKDWIKAANR